ncbi:glycosyltransferase family 39 protein [Candidatus Shapirobacteria bacterium]|nr:glycosyltransferase family 39 protein [Candidatus Shapirobacteria bacterium]
MRKKFISFSLWGFVLLSYIGSLGLAKVDTDFSFRWLSFWLWFSAVAISFSYLVLGKIKKCQAAFGQDLLLPMIFLLSLCVSFSLLKTYPFVAVLDEIRDGGLNARQILEGSITNIHGYGRYESHGLIIPTLITPFYLIFKNSVFTYRVPTAIVSILDILVVYLLARKILDKRSAFWAAIILIGLPLHLYYARTEIVVITSSLLTSLIILFLYFLLRDKKVSDFLLLGLFLGFSAGFHASVKTVVIVSFLVALGLGGWYLLQEKNRREMILGLIFLPISFLIGFGPRLLFTPPEIFFHLRTATSLKAPDAAWGDTKLSSTNLLANYKDLGRNYLKSVRSYFDAPIGSHYQAQKPLLSPLVSLFFVIGLLTALFSKNRPIFRLLALFAFLLPLLNSAATDCVNCDHRLAPFLPVSALLAALGIKTVLERTDKFSSGQWILGIRRGCQLFLLVYLLLQGYFFFASESASKGKSSQDYLSMYTVYLLKSLPPQRNLCLLISPNNFTFFDYLHIKEQYDYFLPNTVIQKEIFSPTLENEIYVSKACNTFPQKGQFILFRYCQENKRFICPGDLKDKEGFNVYVEKSLL